MGKKKVLSKENLSSGLRLISYVFKYFKIPFIVVLVCITISAVSQVASSVFTMLLIDKYITPMLNEATPDFQPLVQALIILAIVFIIGLVCNYIYQRMMSFIAQGVLKKLRDEMFEHLQTLPLRYFDSHLHGDIMSLFTNDTDALTNFYVFSVPQLFNAVTNVIVIFIAMIITNWILTLVVIAIASCIAFITSSVSKKSSRLFMQRQDLLAKQTAYIEEMTAGLKVIKVFCHEEQAKEGFHKINGECCEVATKAGGLVNILMPATNNLGYWEYIIVALLGGAMLINGMPNITIGKIASFLQYTRAFTSPIGLIAQQMPMIVLAFAASSRIFSLLDEPSEQDNGYVKLVNCKEEDGHIVPTNERTGAWAWCHPHQDGSETTYTRLAGDIRMFNVDFGYVPGKDVLHDITLYAEPGQKVALVGATGAGKTTITNLINRFYDIDDGKIRYDGININKINKTDLRNSLGIVLQDTVLFTGTVKDNIRYGKLDATDEEIIAAAKLANADGFIRMLPQGYDTILTESGSGLSQGQRQLIAIARAAIANPPVMILDEATSSIDTHTERLVQEGMDALMKGRTVFVIAHRLSTIKNSDVIMVLDHGVIIERGTHEALLAKKGYYYQLYTGAFELE